MDRTIVRIAGLAHRYPDGRWGLRGVDLEVSAGAFVVLAGANGSGKTTLLYHLNGLLAPTEGTVEVDGVAVAADPQRARRRVGMMFQDAHSQIIGDTVGEDVAFGPENLGLEPAEVDRRVSEALSRTGLAQMAERRPHLLSGGEKRRLAIAAILAMRPQVVAFDEPFASLDLGGVRQVLGLMLDLHRSGHTVLVATHDLEKVLAHAERMVVLADGKVAADGPPAAVAPGVERFGVRCPPALRGTAGLEALTWLN